MEWYELYDVAERYIEVINPCSPQKIIEAGEVLELHPTSRVIDFGCGYGEPLAIWCKRFGISAVGVEFRHAAVARAKRKMAERGLSERIEIVHAKGAEYQFVPHSFDIASCMGASFIWNGYPQTVRAMKEAVKPGGRMLIGEPYWIKTPQVPEEVLEGYKIYFEHELLEMARAEGFTFEYLIRSSEDEWARYNAANWRGLVAWLRENPHHPDYHQVRDWLNKEQDTYLRWLREYMGWALYILAPLA